MPEELPAVLITWEKVYSLCRQLVRQLRKANFRIDVIVAIARSGFVLKTVSKFIPDFYAGTVSEWRWHIYPWAVNEDLSGMIAKMRLDNPDVALLQRQIKQRHGINVTFRQIKDALTLLQRLAK